MSQKFTHQNPFNTGKLSRGSIHKIYYEEYGNDKGKPVVCLHPGFGSASSSKHATYFSPDVYRVILFDQRGCGKSEPLGELRENTTVELVDDIEALRQHLGIAKWHLVFGQAWGSTLALRYAQTYSEAVASMVLHGTTLIDESWNESLYKGTLSFFPEVWAELNGHTAKYLPERRITDMMDAINEMLYFDHQGLRRTTARVWSRWIDALVHGKSYDSTYSEGFPPQAVDGSALVDMARLSCKYLLNNGWLDREEMMRNLIKIQHIPLSIVQDRWDIICPPSSAWEIHRAWYGSRLYVLSGQEPDRDEKLRDICDTYQNIDASHL